MVKEKIRKMLKTEYPGCRIYMKNEQDCLSIRIIHPRFTSPFGSIREVLEKIEQLDEDESFPVLIVEPITEEIWASRRW